MIIDQTYFYNRLNLPQTGNTEGLDNVLDFIEQYEPEFLQCALGYDLYKAFSAGIEGSGSPSEQRWADLLNGAEYTRAGCTYKWVGFQNDEKRSPIANYVFFKFVEEKTTDFTLVGNVVSTTDNNRVASNIDRLVETWNRMVDMTKHLYTFLKVNKSSYPEWKVCGCGCQIINLCSCGCDHGTPEDCGNVYKKINSLGL